MQGGFASVKVLGFVVWCGLAAYRYMAREGKNDNGTFFIVVGVVSAALLIFEFTCLPN